MSPTRLTTIPLNLDARSNGQRKITLPEKGCQWDGELSKNRCRRSLYLLDSGMAYRAYTQAAR